MLYYYCSRTQNITAFLSVWSFFVFEPIKDYYNDLMDNDATTENVAISTFCFCFVFFCLTYIYFCSQVVIGFSRHHSIISTYTHSQPVNKEEISFSGDKERFPTV